MFVPHHLNSYNIKSILIDRFMVLVYLRFKVSIFDDNFIFKKGCNIRDLNVKNNRYIFLVNAKLKYLNKSYRGLVTKNVRKLTIS